MLLMKNAATCTGRLQLPVTLRSVMPRYMRTPAAAAAAADRKAPRAPAAAVAGSFRLVC